MLRKYDAVGLLRAMIDAGTRIVNGTERYLNTGTFPEIRTTAIA